MTRAYEFYETPAGVTAALLDMPTVAQNLDTAQKPIILDPCSGEGAITAVLAERYPHARILTNDLDPSRPAQLHEDATEWKGWRNMRRLLGRGDWVITNPPFSLAHEILPFALDYARVGVAMLLPLRWMEPTQERQDVLKEYPWSAMTVLGDPRPSFTEDGRTDSVTTFWAVWHHGIHPMRLSFATSPEHRWMQIPEEPLETCPVHEFPAPCPSCAMAAMEIA